MNAIIDNLKHDKIEIKWNKSPIEMELFLSFLTVDVERSHNHLGSGNGWTKLSGKDGLVISGGILNIGEWPNNKKIEFLDSIQYKKKLSNPYNNFVNPFWLFEIMTEDGRRFFLDYYQEEIKKLINNQMAKATREKEKHDQMTVDLAGLRNLAEAV